MPIQMKLQLNMTLCGKRVILGTDIEDKEIEPADLGKRVFYGGTLGLDLSISDLINDLAQKFEVSIPEGWLPEIVLKDIGIHYLGETSVITVVAIALIAGKEINLIFQYQPEKDITINGQIQKQRFLVAVLTNIDGFSGLPMVGESLKDVSFANVGLVYTSEAGEYNLPTLGSLPSKEEIENDPFAHRKMTFAKEANTYNKGFHLVGSFSLAKDKAPLPLVVPLSKKPPTNAAQKQLVDSAVAKTANENAPAAEKEKVANENASAVEKEKTEFSDGMKSFAIAKTIGPVTIGKLGFSYKNEEVSLLIDGGIKMGGVSVNLVGLGASFKLSELFKGDFSSLEFQLSGLGIAYHKPPLKISGMFIKAVPQGEGERKEKFSFYGSAEIATAAFGISGIGAYAKLENGQTSFFIYAMYNGPIGGPAFFFVTGIAAGFGYNRSIRIPKINEVNEFPLVAMALNPNPDKTLNDILGDLVSKNWIPSSPGDYWLAVGIKFTSFKLLESFVLVTVQFGTRLEFAILGLSVLNWPGNGLPSIAYIELAVLARFSPDSGVISVEALLTNNSYLFDKNCKISGGFAFYVWVSGEHEGDFVISLGGYHPKYVVPAHYPQVDRLALNWKLSNVLSIRGEMYFALTPKCIMAGGKLEVCFDIGFLKASLVAWLDMYIAWAPFSYSISVGIIVRIEACIKILFVHISFKLQMGAQLEIWGPPFAGKAKVNWSIFSFTIPFGDSSPPDKKALEWTQFKDSFVPKKQQATKEVEAITLKIMDGIISVIESESEKITLVNPYTLILNTDSFFPLKTLKNNGTGLVDNTLMSVAGQDFPTTLGKSTKEFGIKSMDISSLDSYMDFKILKGEDQVQNLAFIANAKGAATALWSHLGMKPEDQNADQNAVIKNVVSGVEIHVLEQEDDRIAEFVQKREEKNANANYPYIRLAEADAYVNEDKVRQLIKDNLNVVVKNDIRKDLVNMGFELVELADLNFDDLNFQTPLYLAKLGQALPSNPDA